MQAKYNSDTTYKSAPRFYYDFYIFQVDFYGSDD